MYVKVEKSLSVALPYCRWEKVSIWHTGVGKKSRKNSEYLVFQSQGAKVTAERKPENKRV